MEIKTEVERRSYNMRDRMRLIDVISFDKDAKESAKTVIDRDFAEKSDDEKQELYKALAVFTAMLYERPYIDHVPRPDWTPCAEGLPKNECKGVWEEYEVTVCESHYPTSSYDPCDAPYSKEIVTTALFDDEQKIWHICRSKEAINALLNEEDYPLNGDAIIAWRDMPAPYNPDRKEDAK